MKKSEETRLSILKNAAQHMYIKGYQATSIDDILSSMQVTKGAFFYHFKNKEEMALAILKELMHPMMKSMMVVPLNYSEDPVKDIVIMMKSLLGDRVNFDPRYGCPLVNLIEEMTPLSEPFSQALQMLTLAWIDAIADCLKRGQLRGKVRQELNTKDAATYIVGAYAGARNMGKMFGPASYQSFLTQFINYTETLS